ncbi:hypothetical protein IKN40_00775 [bacterium]|nr:hypothetical protein [bacterium]MBR6907067.1 hypothetical protein [bacterium]
MTTEHFFLSILNKENKVRNMLNKLGITYDNVYSTIKNMRKGEKIETNDPEVSLEVLSKY